MKLTQDQYDRESHFLIALSILHTLEQRGLLSQREFREATEMLLSRTNPVWGHYPDVTSRR